MKKNKIYFDFNNLNSLFYFVKKIDEFYTYKLQIILQINNDEEVYYKALNSFIYSSFYSFQNNIIKEIENYNDIYDQKNSIIEKYTLYILIISDNETNINYKRKHLINLYNNKRENIYIIKKKIKKFLQWIIKKLNI